MNRSAGTTLLVVAKSPRPGRVKTRLSPCFTAQQAADLATAALADTLAAVAATPARRRVLALEGPVGDWCPPGFEVRPQRGAGLDQRIAHALSELAGPTLLIGMDTPQVRPTQLTVRWDDYDAWWGPAVDGGFWALGLADPDPDLVAGVPMSRPDTGALQLERLRAAGLRVGVLPTLRDVDTPACAAAVARVAPDGRFGRLHAALTASPRSDDAGVAGAGVAGTGIASGAGVAAP